MLRFILETKQRDQHSGLETKALWTLDMQHEELEAALRCGGSSLNGFDHTDLVGVEVRDDPREVVEK